MSVPSPRFARLAKISLAVVSLAATLGILEIGLRLSTDRPPAATALAPFFEHHPSVGWVGRANVRQRFASPEFDCQVTHGPDGCRRTPAVDSDREIWLLGDSMTWGWGVDDEETFAYRFAESLGHHARVRNFGCSGYSTLQELLLLRQRLETDRNCEHVLVFFVENDPFENVDANDQDPPRPYLLARNAPVSIANLPVPRSRFGWVKKRMRTSRLYSLVHFRIHQARARWRSKNVDSDQPTPLENLHWRAVRYSLAAMATECAARGITFTIVPLPGRAETGDLDAPTLAEFETLRRDRLCRIADDIGAEFLDPTDQFIAHYQERESTKPALYFPTDPHLTAEGHRIVADVLAERWMPQMASRTSDQRVRR